MMNWKRKILSQKDEQAIEKRIKSFEENTNGELIISVLRAADPYPAASLRFAILSTFFTGILISFNFEFEHEIYFLMALSLITLFFIIIGKIPYFKKLCFSSVEVSREVQEKAIELFHSLGLANTQTRIGSLLVLSLQEHKLELLIDKTIKEKIKEEELTTIISQMIKHFKDRNYAIGILKAIDLFEEQIKNNFPEKLPVKEQNELEDKVVWLDFS